MKIRIKTPIGGPDFNYGIGVVDADDRTAATLLDAGLAEPVHAPPREAVVTPAEKAVTRKKAR